MENGPFTDDFPNKTSIYNGFSIAMLNYQRVYYDILNDTPSSDISMTGVALFVCE